MKKFKDIKAGKHKFPIKIEIEDIKEKRIEEILERKCPKCNSDMQNCDGYTSMCEECSEIVTEEDLMKESYKQGFLTGQNSQKEKDLEIVKYWIKKRTNPDGEGATFEELTQKLDKLPPSADTKPSVLHRGKR